MMDKLRDFFKKYWYFICLCLIFTAGIFYRLEVYCIPKLLTFDEAQLIYNFTENDGFLWTFSPLQNLQVAPPLFLISVKILTLLFGFKPGIFTLIPAISGIASIFAFYYLSKKFLTKKRSIIFANTLFLINYILISYSNIFKQYISDTLIFMLVLIFVSKIEVKNLKNTDILKYSLGFTLIFLFSQPVIFILFGFTLYHFIITLKEILKNDFSFKNPSCILKNFKFCLIPVLPLIFAIILKASLPEGFTSYMDEYWQIGFLSIENLIPMLKENFNFFIYQSKYLYPLLPFLLIGFIIFASKKKRINRIFLLSLFGAILASVLHLYPLLIRVIIYLIPFFIIFIAAPFDIEFFNKKIDKIFSCMLVMASIGASVLFSSHIIFKNNMKIFLASNEARAINPIFFENFKKDDTLILPTFSKTIYDYYSKQNGFKTDNILEVYSYNKDKFLKGLDKIEKNKTYWIYLISDEVETRQEKLTDKRIEDLRLKNKVYSYKTKLGGMSSLYLLRINP